MLRRAALLACAALLLPACGSGTSDDARALEPAVRETTRRPGSVRSVYLADVTLKVTGAETLTWTKRTKIDVDEIRGEAIPKQLWFLSASAAQSTDTAPDGRMLAYSVNVAPGTYRGPGTYVISTDPGPPVDGVRPNIGGNAYVQFLTVQPTVEVVRYDQLTKDCSFVYAAEARSGSLTCPQLSSEDGASVSFTWTWERV